MRRFTAVLILCLAVLPLLSLTAAAGVPIQINHQGILTDAVGTPVSGAPTLTFHIFESPVGGVPLWSEVHPGVTMAEGLFNVTLGSVTVLSSDVLAPEGSGISSDEITRFLEVQVDADPPLAPRTRLIAAPYAVASGRVAGDIETGPGSFTIKNAPGNHLQGAVDVLQARISLSTDSDFDGLNESELTQVSRSSGANLAIKTKGTGAQRLGSTIGATTDSAGVKSGYDDDGDGENESEVTVVARKSMGRMKCSDITLERAYHSTVSADSSGSSLTLESKLNPSAAKDNFLQGAADVIQARLIMGSDLDDDGIEDVTYEQSTGNAGGRLAIKTKGTSAKRFGMTAVANADSSSVECTFDENNDGLYETNVTQTSTDSTAGVELRYRAGTRVFCGTADRVAQGQFECDSDADGIMDNIISQVSADSTANVTVVSRFGSGPRQTTSMDGSFSHSSHRTATDVDADGTPEFSTENYSDATSARGVVTASSPVSGNSTATVVNRVDASGAFSEVSADIDGNGTTDRRVSVNGSAAGSSIGIEDMGTRRFLLSPDSGIQQYDAGGTKTVDFDANGEGYIAGNMKFGAIAGTHRIDVEGGAYCDGTNWVNASDANSKENFAKVDGREILNKLERLDITRWNYKGQADAAHIGPTAQDFREVFGVGADDKSISTIDPSGIALAAIKELNRQNQQLREQNELLLREILDIKKAVADLRTSQ